MDVSDTLLVTVIWSMHVTLAFPIYTAWLSLPFSISFLFFSFFFLKSKKYFDGLLCINMKKYNYYEKLIEGTIKSPIIVKRKSMRNPFGI